MAWQAGCIPNGVRPDKAITNRTRLGFIGLGYLGSRIARRLAAAGFPLTVWDLDAKKAERFSIPGAG